MWRCRSTESAKLSLQRLCAYRQNFNRFCFLTKICEMLKHSSFCGFQYLSYSFIEVKKGALKKDISMMPIKRWETKNATLKFKIRSYFLTETLRANELHFSLKDIYFIQYTYFSYVLKDLVFCGGKSISKYWLENSVHWEGSWIIEKILDPLYGISVKKLSVVFRQG